MGALMLGSSLLVASAARADKLDCPSASEEAQRLRDKSRYLEARELLRQCAQTSCPAIVRKDCAKWLVELDESMPSVVIAAQDASGTDVANVKVELDGTVIATKLDGSPIAIDPGDHVLRAEAEGQTPITQKLIARVNEKNRIVRVAFVAPKQAGPIEKPLPPPPPPDSRSENGIPTLTWVLAGVGVVGLGGFAFFGLTSKNELSTLRSTCAPFCDQKQLDDVKSGMLIADISLGVGVVALGIATVLAISHMSSSPSKTAAR